MREAGGLTLNQETILLPASPTRTAVYEELVHAEQFARGVTIEAGRGGVLQFEIEAAETLIRNRLRSALRSSLALARSSLRIALSKVSMVVRTRSCCCSCVRTLRLRCGCRLVALKLGHGTILPSNWTTTSPWTGFAACDEKHSRPVPLMARNCCWKTLNVLMQTTELKITFRAKQEACQKKDSLRHSPLQKRRPRHPLK